MYILEPHESRRLKKYYHGILYGSYITTTSYDHQISLIRGPFQTHVAPYRKKLHGKDRRFIPFNFNVLYKTMYEQSSMSDKIEHRLSE